jgi:hypothetical protein
MEKIKERDERTVKLEQIVAVTACLSIHTLRVYLNNFCFKPFKRVVFDNPRKHFEYVYQKDFFNTLYTFLINKRQHKAAENLRDTLYLTKMNLEYLEK